MPLVWFMTLFRATDVENEPMSGELSSINFENPSFSKMWKQSRLKQKKDYQRSIEKYLE